jgi:hypothetical protein
MRTVRSPARLLRHTATHVVELVSIPKTDAHASRQQHKGSEPHSRPGPRRSPANPRTSRRGFRPLAQHRPNRRLLLLRRPHHSQPLTVCDDFSSVSAFCFLLSTLPSATLPALQWLLRRAIMSGPHVVAMYSINSVHADYVPDNSNLRAHQPNLTHQFQRFSVSAFQHFP